MIGLTDPWIAGTYVLCILSALLCVVYGLLNWNRDDDEEGFRLTGDAAAGKSGAQD